MEHGGWSGLPALPALSGELLCAVSAGRRARRPAAVLPRLAPRRGARWPWPAARSALVHGVFVGDADARRSRRAHEGRRHGLRAHAWRWSSARVRAAQRRTALRPCAGAAALHPDVVRQAVGGDRAEPAWATPGRDRRRGGAVARPTSRRLADAGVADRHRHRRRQPAHAARPGPARSSSSSTSRPGSSPGPGAGGRHARLGPRSSACEERFGTLEPGKTGGRRRGAEVARTARIAGHLGGGRAVVKGGAGRRPARRFAARQRRASAKRSRCVVADREVGREARHLRRRRPSQHLGAARWVALDGPAWPAGQSEARSHGRRGPAAASTGEVARGLPVGPLGGRRPQLVGTRERRIGSSTPPPSPASSCACAARQRLYIVHRAARGREGLQRLLDAARGRRGVERGARSPSPACARSASASRWSGRPRT